MTYSTLISTSQLHALQTSGADVQVWDCSFDLMAPTAGLQAYAQGHIAGARYVHLDHDLSDKTSASGKASAGGHPTGPVSGESHPTGPANGGRHPTGPASGGRHPLPSRDTFATWLGHIGVTPATQVVVYDRNGCNYCGRAWWMLQWCGHANVAVLDGGWQAWQTAGGAVGTGDAVNPDYSANHKTDPQKTPPLDNKLAEKYPLQPANTAQAAIDFVAAAVRHDSHTIIDARAAPRFRGEVEPLDPVAGHIPGALNRPFTLNLGTNGHFKPAATLRAEFDALLAGRDPSKVIHHCGSGVSAVPNILAMAIAGYPPTQLFAGSWSEWSNRADLPVAKG